MPSNLDPSDVYAQMQEQHRKMDLRAQELTGFWPVVYFKIPATGLWRVRFYKLINSLLVEFVERADEMNAQQARVMSYHGFHRPNEESGIGICTIDGFFIAHCKMYVCDGTRDSAKYNPGKNYRPWRGLFFRDHADSNTNTAKVFIIADAFQRFLTSKGIKFERVNASRERSK